MANEQTDTHSVETLLLNCWNGNLNDVKLEAPQVLQSLDVHGVARNILETMICIACQRQTYFLLEYCLTLGYDTPGLISKDEPTTPIWNAAIKSPNFDIWKLLIENGLIGHEDQVQQSRLRSLASTGMRADIPHVELLDELFRLGLRISTSLLNIAAQEADQNTMRYLMSKCELRDLEESNALLMAAACNGRLVELLLNSGMNVNADGCESNDPFDFRASTTPLHNAASNGNEESVKLLLERGASKTKRDSQGKTAADVATENGHLRIIVLIHGFEDWVTPRTYPVENQKLYFKFS